jgi:tryptophan-rich sensory protein
MISGRLANSGYGNPWFDALAKPAIMPPGWAFPVAWTLLYVLMAIALAIILAAPPSKARSVGIAFFVFQLVLNLAWSPVFFAMHRIMLAFGLILAILVWAGATTIAFWKIKPLGGALMLPYLAWLAFAATLNWQIHQLNPNATVVIPQNDSTRIVIQ